MSLHGDLSTLDLTNLFQNLESARKTGLLTVHDEGDETQLFFQDGKLALIAYPKRAALVDYLVASGEVSADDVEKAKKSRRRGQGLAAALVEAGLLAADRLAGVASARLIDEACEVLASGASGFELAEVECPAGVFDPDERALALAMPASPLLLESARRSDHWAMIREHLPSDSAHLTVVRPPRAPEDRAKARAQASVLRLLDGSRSVREVVGHFPTRRFETYQLLADLTKAQAIKPVAAADLNTRVLELARRDRKRALALLERGLEQSPHQLTLLCTKAMLAEKVGEIEQAAEALKLVLHLQLENDEKEAARATIDRLKHLDADQPFAWEKSYELALAEGRRKDAIADARKLVDVYRKPGLHRKVVSVLERLLELLGSSWELERDLARARAESGDRAAAAKGLEQFAARAISLESYPLACKAYEEILAIHPTHAKAKETLRDLKNGAVAQRKAHWRGVRRRALAGFVVFVLLPWVGYEALARRAFVGATRALVSGRLLETGRYGEARELYRPLAGFYAWSTTALFDVEPVLAELDARVSAVEAQPAAPPDAQAEPQAEAPAVEPSGPLPEE